jgi:hypothetical protein
MVIHDAKVELRTEAKIRLQHMRANVPRKLCERSERQPHAVVRVVRPSLDFMEFVATVVKPSDEAGALPCTNRAFMNQIEALGVSFEREADSPICWKQ